MSARRTPRGASRPTRKQAPARPRGGASRTPARGSGNGSGGIRKGRLLLALLVLAVLVALIWHVTRKPAAPVEAVPAALAEDKPVKPAKGSQPARTEQAPERFEFYDILPNQQVLPTRTPENRPAPRPRPTQTAPSQTAPAPTGASADAAAPRWLQVGAFRSAAEADRRRAQVGLLGLPARTQAGSDGQGTALHRVLAGPFNAIDSLEAARRTLAAAGLDAIPLSNPGVEP